MGTIRPRGTEWPVRRPRRTYGQKERGKAAGRVYARLTRHERNTLELMLGERAGKTRLFCCDPMRSDQKGACEKNHVETRRLLSKGRGISLDRLAPEDCALVMSPCGQQR